MIDRKALFIGGALAALTIPAAAMAPGAAAPAWKVDRGASRVEFTGVGNGSEFTGSFDTWDAAINFDPDNLGASAAKVTIDTASVRSDDPTRDDTLRESNWFAPAIYPDATFATTGIRKTGAEAYVADGTLTMRGTAETVQLPFKLTITGDHADMSGSLTIDRTHWEIGKGTWQDHSVDPMVTIRVKVSADGQN